MFQEVKAFFSFAVTLAHVFWFRIPSSTQEGGDGKDYVVCELDKLPKTKTTGTLDNSSTTQLTGAHNDLAQGTWHQLGFSHGTRGEEPDLSCAEDSLFDSANSLVSLRRGVHFGTRNSKKLM